MSNVAVRRNEPQFIDFHPPRADMRSDVLAGLSRPQKEILPKYFYDARGSGLFEDITRLPEYYLTRTENAIMEASIEDIVRLIGPRAAVIEFGSGSGVKIRRLLNHLVEPVACVPVEISRGHLLASARALAADHPQLDIIAVCADFTRAFELPPIDGARRKLVFFPGSTIGNFPPQEAINLLKLMNHTAGEGGALLLGADLVKDSHTLESAYNDSAGVTAAFNLNLLVRINHELGADFNLKAFHHLARYNEVAGRIEMFLVSQQEQFVHIGDTRIHFASGEHILTEFAYKYELDAFANMVAMAGLKVERVWTDAQRQFSVQYLLRDRPVERVPDQSIESQ